MSEHVLQDKVRNYPKKNRFNDMLKPLTGEGLLTSDGEVWRQRRRLSQPAFHRQRLAGFATGMTEATQAMLARWTPLAERGQTLDISREMQRVTLSIVGRALFSADISAGQRRDGPGGDKHLRALQPSHKTSPGLARVHTHAPQPSLPHGRLP